MCRHISRYFVKTYPIRDSRIYEYTHFWLPQGGAAFSQVEARNVRDAMLSVANQTKVYFSFHSYGQYWMTPCVNECNECNNINTTLMKSCFLYFCRWGYTSELPDNYQDMVCQLNVTRELLGNYLLHILKI